jgi:Arc/MetJ-type ribon-helix-helix transcriptional regulator
MAKITANDNEEILRYALSHLEKERDAILEKIAAIRAQLGVRRGRPPLAARSEAATSAPAVEKKTRVLSPAARKRISAAQKKRWAEARKATASAQ